MLPFVTVLASEMQGDNYKGFLGKPAFFWYTCNPIFISLLLKADTMPGEKQPFCTHKVKHIRKKPRQITVRLFLTTGAPKRMIDP